MSFFSNLFEALKDAFNFPINPVLSEFQRKKLMHEFHLFYDIDKNGKLQWDDFDLAKKNICKLNGWKYGSEKFTDVHELFRELWLNLSNQGDEDLDGEITQEEWLELWLRIYKAQLEDARKKRKAKRKAPEQDCDTEPQQGASYIPKWFEKYIVYKFNLLDRAGDGILDTEEFEYVLNDGFGVPAKDCRAAFTLLSQGNQKTVDRDYFRELALEYYFSDDPGALGNFINGKLTYD